MPTLARTWTVGIAAELEPRRRADCDIVIVVDVILRC